MGRDRGSVSGARSDNWDAGRSGCTPHCLVIGDRIACGHVRGARAAGHRVGEEERYGGGDAGRDTSGGAGVHSDRGRPTRAENEIYSGGGGERRGTKQRAAMASLGNEL